VGVLNPTGWPHTVEVGMQSHIVMWLRQLMCSGTGVQKLHSSLGRGNRVRHYVGCASFVCHLQRCRCVLCFYSAQAPRMMGLAAEESVADHLVDTPCPPQHGVPLRQTRTHVLCRGLCV
jgi:hypothetical protein